MRPSIALFLFLTAGACTLSVSTQRSYENYSVYKVFVKTRSDQQVIDQLLEQTDNYNLWHRGLHDVHIMVSPKARENFLKNMQKENIKVKLLIKDVQKLIDEQRNNLENVL
ncbi:uncharacterized protein LOC108033750 [Drosophila biarmipes]|uniref:uncharacterized protein LOC108033750 n=1 Tax=Drosophila biarmipes TaxID=125945 RepID=UPI0007E6F5CC|nr:uncharacterized protein LOC108033750 [Drosophila biarmipes]